jgi:hypothetical protein
MEKALSKCFVNGCCNEVAARGLCNTHYRREQRHGNVEQTRPADWGAREKHPLYSTWSHHKRSKVGMCELWRKDFWKFVSDIGERPEGHRLLRVVDKEEMSPSNYCWKLPTLTNSNKDRNKYMQAYRRLNPKIFKDIELKKRFGISVEDYDKMLAAQKGVCAICGNPETTYDPRHEKVKELAVDHNHTTGVIRGLLCRGCNQGLGNFKEDSQRIQKALKYLQQYCAVPSNK